jgi:formylglycine-generating enzyme required for sulfatase activity
MKNTWTFLVLVPTLSMAQVALPKKTSQEVRTIKQMPNVMIDAYEVTLGDWFAYIQNGDTGYNREDIENKLPMRTAIPEKLRDTFDKMIEVTESGENAIILKSINSKQMLFAASPFDQVESHLRYPITGLVEEQIREYLQWREDLMNQDKTVSKLGIKCTARLLTPDEWDKLATYSGPRQPENKTMNPDSSNVKGCYLMNIKYQKGCESMERSDAKFGAGLYPVASFFADANGLYDIFGNVAEMTSEPGVAKGGSYRHWGRECFSGNAQSFDKEEDWVGFRVVFEFSKGD